MTPPDDAKRREQLVAAIRQHTVNGFNVELITKAEVIDIIDKLLSESSLDIDSGTAVYARPYEATDEDRRRHALGHTETCAGGSYVCYCLYAEALENTAEAIEFNQHYERCLTAIAEAANVPLDGSELQWSHATNAVVAKLATVSSSKILESGQFQCRCGAILTMPTWTRRLRCHSCNQVTFKISPPPSSHRAEPPQP